ncbi:MAG: endolytic transglycosylase MltG [Bacteroidales bacterium]
MKNNKLSYLLSISSLFIIVSVFVVYRILYGLNVKPGEHRTVILIPEGSSYARVMDSVKFNLRIKNLKVLEWVAGQKHYPSLVKPGRYVFDRDLSYVALINILRSGRQTPVKITFSNIRTLNDLAGKVGGRIEPDSSEIIAFLSDTANYGHDGFTRDNIISVFIPDTYEFFWNTSPGRFYSRMLKEYRKFWNDERLARAKEKDLSQVEVAILASIIDEEAVRPDEKPRIAGVYLNRLKRGIPLQADPTIRFALNDFSITRVLTKYLKIKSPYNTYIHNGFPPGPIACPTVEGIDAVLNAENHDYLYFAAKPDFSGYHNFSRTLAEHNRNAALYQKELNKRKIFR